MAKDKEYQDASDLHVIKSYNKVLLAVEALVNVEYSHQSVTAQELRGISKDSIIRKLELLDGSNPKHF
ncbi:MAG: hypothetical protein V4485_01375 [Pseudomonadota bacterium]